MNLNLQPNERRLFVDLTEDVTEVMSSNPDIVFVKMLATLGSRTIVINGKKIGSAVVSYVTIGGARKELSIMVSQ